MLLGASNLTLAFPLVVDRVRALVPAPVEVLAAIGHGRSYGRPSRVLVRELPGILQCGLWRALDAGPRTETFAVISDLGNDLVYGSKVEEIAGWIARILERIAAHRARTVIVRLPLASVEALSPLRFRVARGILYPSHPGDLGRLRDRAVALDDRVAALAKASGAALVDSPGRWYGLDPVHIRGRRRDEAWRAILDPLHNSDAAAGPPPLARSDRRALRRTRPEIRRWMGLEQRHTQPCARLSDGTSVSVY